jgi:predicted ATP-binding protein involved in virulence
MKEIHENIFNHLRSQYPDLTFVLRERNTYGRLKQGYWFLGGNANPERDYLCVSFWNVRDGLNKTPKIYLNVELTGKTILILVDKDSPKDNIDGERSAFFKKIAPALKVNQIRDRRTGEERQVWAKEYEGNNYLDIIDNFIKGDKVLIDTFIVLNNKELLFPLVDKEEFKNRLKKIAEIRPSLNTELNKWENIVIQRLKLKNIGHFEDLEIDFNFDNQKRVAVFFGQNGSGKSTILQTIALGLAGKKDRKTISEENRKEDNKQNENLAKLLRIEKVEDNIRHYSTTSYVELGYNKQYRNVIAFNWIEEDDIQVTEDSENSDYQNFEGDNFLCLVKGFSQNKKVENDSDLDKKLSESNSKKPVTADLRPLIYQYADDSFKNFKNWITDAANDSAYYNKIKPAMAKAFEIIAIITEGNFELIPVSATNPEVSIRTPDAPDGIPIELISQGYSNVIGWVGDFVKRLYQTTAEDKKNEFEKSFAICLIDEIDTYLHPKWQRTILKTLADTFVNTHFIVTTHSPLVITSLPKELATIYHVKRFDNQNIRVIDLWKDEEFNSYSSDIDYFIEKAMGFDSREVEVRKLFDEYEAAIKKAAESGDYKKWEKEIEEKEKGLKAKIDRRDPELRRLQIEKEVEKNW